MKLLKRLVKGLLILLILASAGAIIYVLQWEEKPPEVKLPRGEARQAEQSKAALPGAVKDKLSKEAPLAAKAEPAKEKEKIIVSKIGKIPLPQREVAIIIDDIGNDLAPVRELLKFDAAITFAILPFCSHTHDAAKMLHAAQREILLHLPMEPASFPREKPGNGALYTDMNNQELLSQLDKNLASVPYISGVNNHMGSKFMADGDKLRLIFERLKKNNLFFIDSRTTSDSRALAVSEKVGLPLASRRIFLDNKRDYKDIYKILVEIAQNKGSGDASSFIVIGHPYPETIRALKDALPVLRANGVAIVPASKLFKDKARSGSS